MACGGKILIIDGDPETRDALSSFARGVGCCAVTASDGVAGLAEVMAGPPPCLVVLDVDAPRLSGEELVRRIRRNAPEGGVCIVSLSRSGGRELAPPCVERHLGKPFSADVLWPLIERRCRSAIRIEAEVPATYVEADA